MLDRGSGGGDRTQRRTDALVPTPVTVGGAVRRRHALTRGPASGALRACSLGEQRVGGLCSPLAQRRRRHGTTSKRSGQRPCTSVGSVWRLYRAPRTARNARRDHSLPCGCGQRLLESLLVTISTARKQKRYVTTASAFPEALIMRTSENQVLARAGGEGVRQNLIQWLHVVCAPYQHC